MSESAVAERPAGAGLDDLALSPAEQGEEARREGLTAEERIAEDGLREQLEVMTVEEIADAAAEKEQALGGSAEAVEYARAQALKSAAAAQAELDESKPMEETRPMDVMVPPDKLMVSGTAKGSHKWNGKAPTQTFLMVKGMKIEVPEGEFKAGERLMFKGELLVYSEGKEDVLDKDTKAAVDAVQAHKAVVLDFELTD